jgi:hypothetical protein
VPSWPSVASRFLVGPDLGEGLGVRGRIVLDRDLRGHAAHREGAARWQVLISSCE